MIDLQQLIAEAPDNFVIQNALIRCAEVVAEHTKIVCSVSGGADSDVMVDMLIRCGAKEKTTFVFYDTSMEMRATLEQLDFLENKYGIKIERVKAKKSIPVSCLEYGIPFWSKDVSEKVGNMQKHGFLFEDKEYETLIKEYPTIKSRIEWWCNTKQGYRFSIKNVPFLREFMAEFPPDFQISIACCKNAKKNPSREFVKDIGADLVCIGVRKDEGGVRSTAYKTCFSEEADGPNHFRPLWWMRDSDKNAYCAHYGVTHSRCYTEYGFARTGCTGCPFNKQFERDLSILREHEPNLYRAANHVFGKSYDYTRKYLAFREEMKEKKKLQKKGETANETATQAVPPADGESDPRPGP